MNQRVFCRFCLDFYGCLRNYEFHFIKKHNNDYNLWNLSSFSINYRLQKCKDARNRSIYYFIFTFKPILGKDVTLLIAKLIHGQRLEDWWIRGRRPRIHPKKKSLGDLDGLRPSKSLLSTIVKQQISSSRVISQLDQ
jgi:hypothetical protein